MNIPLSWLKEFVDIDVPIRQFMEDMTMTGSAAESYVSFGADINKVVVGRITAIEKHPNADKLLVCKVDIGSGADINIVTGATNLKNGDYVPVALHGAALAGGLTIKKGKLRGEVSEGMLCSVEELGYTRQDYPESPEDGIYVFEHPQQPGADVKPILQLEEDVIEFEIYSNRPDCQSVLGIAREAAATYGKVFTLPAITVKEQADDSSRAEDYVEIEIKSPDLCPRYVARIVKNVRIGPSPQWLRHRLTTSGIRPINNIVDITNYVMLEYGQPLHAFDIDEIGGKSADGKHKIIVRNAAANEKFTTLDGIERQLDETMLVIADPQKALAIAGIMGGENSKVTGGASAVLFESANFDATNIRLSSKKLGMRTDASSKFEKGIDPNLALLAVNRAMQLVEELACGEVVCGLVDNYPRPRHSWTVSYNEDNINRLLGTNINNMENLLARVGIEAKDGKAVIPTFRPDITCEADIAEEVARIFGYNNIPVTKAQRNITGGGKNLIQRGEDSVKRIMTALGYSEALTSSFEGPKILDKLNIPKDSPLREAVTILNPLGEDFSILRTTPLNGMLQSLSVNFNRRNEVTKLFELTKVYLPRHKDESAPLLPEEPVYLTIGAYGPKIDFFDVKGDIEEFLSVLGIKQYNFTPGPEAPHLHPGRTASLHINGKLVGQVGELHPNIAESYEIGTRAYIASFAQKPLLEGIDTVKTYVPLPKFPSITRDIALLVKDDISASQVEEAIKAKAGPLLAKLVLFDIYQGKQVEEGYKSMAYALSFRANDKTLVDEEVSGPMNAVLSHLKDSLGIRLRDK